MLSTPHAHTRYVDGLNTPREMVEAAIAQGFSSLGLSEHAHEPFDRRYGLAIEDEASYLAEVQALRAEYAGRLPLWIGIERDQDAEVDRARYQYVIGSKHYLVENGVRFAVDGPMEQFERGCQLLFGGDYLKLAQRYFLEFADYIDAYRPDIIGHFDLLAKYVERTDWLDQEDPKYLRAGCDALERMAATGALLEINTGAIARGWRTAPYPASAFLKRWRSLGGRIILSSDCHDARKLSFGYAQATELAREAGFKAAWALGAGGQLFEEYAL